ncbi:hypothetical protein [Ignatzschineria cameli]|uniref:Uncharacterized protein n=1 Tax=Ignatzschineria cameli TaxID=2182793 RepID=A0A2U2AQU3_9GAMM|nr:hypothetical protein [Ignatzschineria cameli]PWD85324.1 hypothetical protein DC080_06610 [Ignatzschineria cameli]PWD86245.1 hypothetical protein DC077_05755 [Ignatzschineria cameli]PWD89918.1 hypothetical protein DC079_06175 [Ignatzschineria cameli]PWD91568.1 hypothetical protein DC081_05885 [Ignatzschineria cameli]PWD92605.1 hypothetical protein DC078_06170 [Ignatzschineria cameli]
MKKMLLTVTLLALSPAAFSHTALLSCFDEGDGTITCEGGFSDGSSASGVDFYVEQEGKKVLEMKFDELNSVNFEKPEGDYSAVFNGGDGHRVILKGAQIN